MVTRSGIRAKKIPESHKMALQTLYTLTLSPCDSPIKIRAATKDWNIIARQWNK